MRARDFGVRGAARVAREALALGLRVGAAQPLLRERVFIPVTGAAEETEPSLVDHLRQVVGRDDLHIAVRIGRPRPNRKPLLSLHAGDGTTLGFAKIGWNEGTRGLVRNEARALNELAAKHREIRTFDPPRLLHLGPWRDLEILIVSGLAAARWTKGSHARATFTAMREIAGLGPPVTTELGRGEYWTRQRDRSALAGAPSLDDAAKRIEERYGDEPLVFGAFHGDWTPWNVGGSRDRLAIWDWERSGRLAPVIVDAAHFDFHTALATTRGGPVRALDSALGRGRLMLRGLDLPVRDERLALTLDMLEMSLRHAEGAEAGTQPKRSAHFAALETLISRF